MAAAAGSGAEPMKGGEEDIPIEKSVSEFTEFYDNINKILKKGNSENTYSKKVSDYMGKNYAEKFVNGFEPHSDVFSKKVIRTNERFFNIMYYLIKKRLHTVNLRRMGGRGRPINWINFKSGKNGLETNINEINTYLKRGGVSGWFSDYSNLFKDDESITFKYNGVNFEFKSADGRTLFIYLNKELDKLDKEINTKENIDKSLRVETQINTIIDELEKGDGERKEPKIIMDNFKSIIGRLA